MDLKERTRLRKLQDKFLDHNRVKRFVSLHGRDSNLFTEFEVSFNDLKEFVFPECENIIVKLLNKLDG